MQGFLCSKCCIIFETKVEWIHHDCAAKKDVSNQKHYCQHDIQVIEFCERNKLGWCAANVIKYVSRENMKGGNEDLEKALNYLGCLIHYRRTGKFATPDKLNINIEEKCK